VHLQACLFYLKIGTKAKLKEQDYGIDDAYSTSKLEPRQSEPEKDLYHGAAYSTSKLEPRQSIRV